MRASLGLGGESAGCGRPAAQGQETETGPGAGHRDPCLSPAVLVRGLTSRRRPEAAGGSNLVGARESLPLPG